MKYQALRGGRVVLQAVNRPSSDEWDSPLAAMEYVLKLEKEVNQVKSLKLLSFKSFLVYWHLTYCSGSVGNPCTYRYPQRPSSGQVPRRRVFGRASWIHPPDCQVHRPADPRWRRCGCPHLWQGTSVKTSWMGWTLSLVVADFQSWKEYVHFLSNLIFLGLIHSFLCTCFVYSSSRSFRNHWNITWSHGLWDR